MCGRNKVKKKRNRHPGLAAAARAMGVSYQHAWRVIVSGERQSVSLFLRYTEFLKAAKSVETNTTNFKTL